MNPITHFLVGWSVANVDGLNPRERTCVAIAGIIPDVDGVGLVTDFVTRNSEHPLNWWGEYHHLLGHNLLFAVAVTAGGILLAKRRWLTGALTFLSFHLHLLGDLVGARGPDGDQWPIPYFWPFSNSIQLTWSGQWALNAWPNFLLTGIFLLGMFFFAWKRGFSPLEMISLHADKSFISTLRKRFPR